MEQNGLCFVQTETMAPTSYVNSNGFTFLVVYYNNVFFC